MAKYRKKALVEAWEIAGDAETLLPDWLTAAVEEEQVEICYDHAGITHAECLTSSGLQTGVVGDRLIKAADHVYPCPRADFEAAYELAD